MSEQMLLLRSVVVRSVPRLEERVKVFRGFTSSTFATCTFGAFQFIFGFQDQGA